MKSEGKYIKDMWDRIEKEVIDKIYPIYTLKLKEKKLEVKKITEEQAQQMLSNLIGDTHPIGKGDINIEMTIQKWIRAGWVIETDWLELANEKCSKIFMAHRDRATLPKENIAEIIQLYKKYIEKIRKQGRID